MLCRTPANARDPACFAVAANELQPFERAFCQPNCDQLSLNVCVKFASVCMTVSCGKTQMTSSALRFEFDRSRTVSNAFCLCTPWHLMSTTHSLINKHTIVNHEIPSYTLQTKEEKSHQRCARVTFHTVCLVRSIVVRHEIGLRKRSYRTIRLVHTCTQVHNMSITSKQAN